jgi:CBS domain-containing protein
MLDDAIFTAGDLMTRDVAVVAPNTPLLDAVRLMAHRHISGVPVVDGSGTVVGILSEGDLVRWHEGYTDKQTHWLEMLADGFILAPTFLDGIRDQHRTVRSVMASDVVTVTEDMAARDVAHLMYAKNIKRVPVLRDGRLVGIVARSDLIRALAQKLADPEAVGAAERKTLDEALRRGREENLR